MSYRRIFYEKLAEELIDNSYDGRLLRSDGGTPSSAGDFSPTNTGGRPRDCYGIHVMSMRETKKGSKGHKRHTAQLRCRICSKKLHINAANVTIQLFQSVCQRPVVIVSVNTLIKYMSNNLNHYIT